MDNRFALIIGNEIYDDPCLNTGLIAPRKDVEALSALLGDPHIGGFEVTTLVDQPFLEVRKQIARILTGKVKDDTVLIYFSGHGIKDNMASVYLAVKDTKQDLPWECGIDSEFLRKAQERCQSQRQVLILDCCYSGAWTKGTKGPEGHQVDVKEAFLGSGFGQVTITATNAVQEAFEAVQQITDSANSLFTHYLVEGLRTGLADGCPDGAPDGQISDFELYQYAYKNIDPLKSQTPQRLVRHQGPPIVIARNPSFDSTPTEFQELIKTLAEVNSRRDQRASAASALGEYLEHSDSQVASLARKTLENSHLQDPSQMVRQASADALSTIAPKADALPTTAPTGAALPTTSPKKDPIAKPITVAQSKSSVLFLGIVGVACVASGWSAEIVSGVGTSYMHSRGAWLAYPLIGASIAYATGLVVRRITTITNLGIRVLFQLLFALGWAGAAHFSLGDVLLGAFASVFLLYQWPSGKMHFPFLLRRIRS